MQAQPSTVAMAWSCVAQCRSVFLGAEVWDTSALVLTCPDDSALVPKCFTDSLA